MTAIAFTPSPEWNIEKDKKIAKHKSGLSVQIQKSIMRGPAALTIEGLALLSGTEWAAQSSRLVEQGISLLQRV